MTYGRNVAMWVFWVSIFVILSTLEACSASSERSPTGVFDPQTGEPYPDILAYTQEYEACAARAPNNLEYIKAHCIPRVLPAKRLDISVVSHCPNGSPLRGLVVEHPSCRAFLCRLFCQ